MKLSIQYSKLLKQHNNIFYYIFLDSLHYINFFYYLLMNFENKYLFFFLFYLIVVFLYLILIMNFLLFLLNYYSLYVILKNKFYNYLKHSMFQDNNIVLNSHHLQYQLYPHNFLVHLYVL